ncbi:hypothetical protein BLA29_000667 [Euroglyphus maynei]|uniref:Uncharacterized protein n=1 Tax=Euroglyphus maynei TaxID=6958 RepID=A0A1Y3B2F5_EURMA|nr:hypothetical protein BLA29_000667 [Euroglyphus maynei]
MDESFNKDKEESIYRFRWKYFQLQLCDQIKSLCNNNKIKKSTDFVLKLRWKVLHSLYLDCNVEWREKKENGGKPIQIVDNDFGHCDHFEQIIRPMSNR